MNFKKINHLLSQTKIQLLLLVLLVFISYINTLGNGFSFDDQDFFLNWPAVRDSKGGLSALLSLPELLVGELPSHQQGVYRPIRSLYYLFSIKAWDDNPMPYHLQAIVVHLLITILVFFIIKNISKNRWIPIMGASFFATHPIHTEAVSYTAASMDTLGILFFFASFYFYLQAENSKIKRQATRLLSWLFAFLAFFTYEMTLTLPILIICYELCFNRVTFRSFLKRLEIYLPYFSIALVNVVTRVFILKIGSRADFLGEIFQVVSNQAKIATPEILFGYVGLLIFPYNLTISHPAPTELLTTFLSMTQKLDPSGNLLNFIGRIVFLFPIIIVLGLSVITLKLFKRQPFISFGIVWGLLSLLPVINIFAQGMTMAERFLYIPSFGFCLVLAFLVYRLATNKISRFGKNSQLLAVVAILITINSVYITLTFLRNFDWKNEETLYLSALKIHPTDSLANGAMGIVKMNEEKFAEAITFYQASLKSDPDSFKNHASLATAYEKSGDVESAIFEYKKTLELEPKYLFANIKLGNIYQNLKKFDEAITEFNKVLGAEPDNFDAHFNLAGTYLHQEKYQEALQEYQICLKLKPNSSTVYNNIAYIQERMNQPDEAIVTYKKAIELEPNDFYTHFNLGTLYQGRGSSKLALEEFTKALQIQPNNQTLKNKLDATK